MTIYLKQSTASQEVPLGYFVDSADGNTEETALTIANTDIKIWKTGATTLTNKNSGGATHISNGIYYAVLDATDTDTLGPLVIFVHVSGALAVRLECLVVTSAAYDVMTAVTGDAYARLGAPAGASVSADVAAVKSDTAAILVDTGTTLDANITAIKAVTDAIPNAGALTAITTHLTDIKGATFSGETDSLEAIRDRGDAAWITATGFSTHSAADVWAAATRTLTANTNLNDLNAAGIRAAVGLASANLDTQLAALPTAAENSTAVWTTQLTESYAADGVAFTGAQGLFQIYSALTEFAIASTTITCKKLDGTTTAMTFTLDDATNPTSRTRAT